MSKYGEKEGFSGGGGSSQIEKHRDAPGNYQSLYKKLDQYSLYGLTLKCEVMGSDGILEPRVALFFWKANGVPCSTLLDFHQDEGKFDQSLQSMISRLFPIGLLRINKKQDNNSNSLSKKDIEEKKSSDQWAYFS